jgi:hypothetical protein
MSSDSPSFTHIGIHVGADWRVRCSTYENRTPILDINAGSVTVDLSVKGTNADQSAVSFAHELVRNVQAFAAEIERLHAEHATPDTASTPGLAA